MEFSKDELRFLIQITAYGYNLVYDSNDSIEKIEVIVRKYAANPIVQKVSRMSFEVNVILKLIEEYKSNDKKGPKINA